jgi:hypothetical protein
MRTLDVQSASVKSSWEVVTNCCAKSNEERNDVNKCIQTVIYALNTRYKMTFTEADIKRELNMDNEIRMSALGDSVKKIKISLIKKKC